jgi:hypothetical protein
VTEATWARAVRDGIVSGNLRDATNDQLAAVVRNSCWGAACDALPVRLDLLPFNGRMMTGQYARLMQSRPG